jgi:tRNA pseudouridine32 synthase / 23S rRNA pseudouridine746 synthase
MRAGGWRAPNGLMTQSSTSLPVRAGVSASTLVLPQRDELPLNLLSFLEHAAHNSSRIDWQNRLKNGLVVDAQGQALSIDAPYIVGQRIHYWRDAGDEPRIPFDERIIYQDEHILVADKPHFLPVAPTGRYVQETLLVRLKNRTGLEDLVPIHRIDRDTAGLVLFCVQRAERDAYAALFRERRVSKVYECIAPFSEQLIFPLTRQTRLEDSPHVFLQMIETVGEPNSETRIELIERMGDRARYRLHPITGKRHQLRVHMNALGLPMCGDGIYPVLTPEVAVPSYEAPLQLLAQSLAFCDPVTGLAHEFDSQMQLHIL